MSVHRGRTDLVWRALRSAKVTLCMVWPRVARGFVNLVDAVLHQCIWGKGRKAYEAQRATREGGPTNSRAVARRNSVRKAFTEI